MLPAMILCAGFGTRLRPVTDHVAKPLLPIGDRPAFQHIVDQLSHHGFAPLVINTHHRPEPFERAAPGCVRLLHEPSILGTAGGVANAAAALGPGDVLVWNGDIQVTPDLTTLVESHRNAVRRKGAVASLLARPRPAGCGTIGCDQQGRVVRLRAGKFGVEHAGADYLGVMILSQAARDALPAEGCLVGDLLVPQLEAGAHVEVVLHQADWVDIGTPAQFVEANLRWLRARGLQAWVAPNASVPSEIELTESVVADGGLVTGSGRVSQCVVLPGATLEAPAHRCIAMLNGELHVSKF